MADLGLRARYREDEEFNTQIKMLTALAFIPPDDVPATFEMLSETFQEEEASDQLLDYFKSTYVEGPTVRRRQRPPKFPVNLWNHYQDALNKASKTTNCTEGWHNALRGLFQASHPGVWLLFKGIKKDIALQKMVMVKAATEHGEKAKCKYQMLADRLETKLQPQKKLPQFTMGRNLPSTATYRAATYLVPQLTVPQLT